MARTILTQQRLKEFLSYDQTTGKFTRLRAFGRWGQYPATTPFGTETRGYLHAYVDGHRYFLHHLAWLYVYGHFPAKGLDHTDRDGRNNAISNLREVSQSENMQNQGRAIKSNKSTGILGVSAKRDVWRARIAVNGKQRTLGSFDNKESAQAAYLAAKKELHPFGEIAKEVFAIPPKPRAKRDRSVSGFTGVYFRPNGKSWYAEITFERKKYRLGTFYSAEQAHEVFQAAKRKLQAGETL